MRRELGLGLFQGGFLAEGWIAKYRAWMLGASASDPSSSPKGRARIEGWLQAARRVLGEPGFTAAWRAGQALLWMRQYVTRPPHNPLESPRRQKPTSLRVSAK